MDEETTLKRKTMKEELLVRDLDERERYMYFDEMKQNEMTTGRPRLFRRDTAVQDIHILSLSSNAPARYDFVTLRQLLQLITSDFSHSISSVSKEESVLKDILYRDLRRLDYESAHEDAPSLTQRRFCSILVLPPLKCIITSRRLILIVPRGADSLLSYVQDCIEQNDALKDSDSTDFINFEFSACNNVFMLFLAVITDLYIPLYIFFFLSLYYLPLVCAS